MVSKIYYQKAFQIRNKLGDQNGQAIILNNLGKMLFRESRGFEELIGFAGKFTSGLEGEKKGFLISGIASGMARQIFGIEGDPSDEQRVAFKAQVAVNESFLTRSLQVQSQAATPPPVIR